MIPIPTIHPAKAPFNTSFTPNSVKICSYCSAALLQVNSAAAAMAACFIFTTCRTAKSSEFMVIYHSLMGILWWLNGI